MDLQLPGEQWLVGLKASEQDSLLTCPGEDVKQQQDFLCPFCFVTCCHTCRGGTAERAHLRCVSCPFPELLLPKQPSPAMLAQPKATPEMPAHVSPGHRLVSAMAPMTQLLKLEPPRC